MKKNNVLAVTTILATLLLMPIIIGCAKGNGREQGPPPEAIKACEGKEAGDSVTFTGRRGESMEATCQEINGKLAAVPEGMSPGKSRPQ